MDFLLQNAANVNWWAVLLATASTFPIGWVWYDMKMGFGKQWAKLVGLKESDMNGDGMAKTFTSTAILALLTAILLAVILKAMGVVGFWESLGLGVVLGLVLRGGTHIMHNGFAKRPDALTLIDLGHDTLSIAVMCGILGIWM